MPSGYGISIAFNASHSLEYQYEPDGNIELLRLTKSLLLDKLYVRRLCRKDNGRTNLLFQQP